MMLATTCSALQSCLRRVLMGVQEIRTATRAGVLADDRTGVGVETLRRAIQEYLFYRCGNVPALATRSDYYLAVAYTGARPSHAALVEHGPVPSGASDARRADRRNKAAHRAVPHAT